jgi:hypothetical protein
MNIFNSGNTSAYSIFIYLLTLSYLIIFLSISYIFLSYPYQIEYNEGFILHLVKSVNQGKPLYQDLSNYPSLPGFYTPVYTYICAFITKLFGLSFIVGRTISLLSTIGTGIIIYLILIRTTSKKITIISSILFFAAPDIIFVGNIYRVDTLGLFFSFLGIYLVCRNEHTRFVLISIPFFLISVYTKQSFIAAPLAAFGYLLIKKDKKIAVQFLLLFGVSGLVLLGFANLITDGQFIIHTVLHPTTAIYDFKMLLYFSFEYLLSVSHPLTLVIMLYVLYLLYNKRISLFVVYFVISYLISFSIGKRGSSTVYFIENIAVSCILFGYLLSDLNTIIKQHTLIKLIIIALLIYPIYPIYTFWGYHHLNINESIAKKVSKYVKQSKGKVLTMDAGSSVLNGKDLLYEPFVSSNLVRSGLLDQSKLLEDLRNKRISLIVLKSEWGEDLELEELSFVLTDEIIHEISNNYMLQEQIGNLYIYKPLN